MLSKRKIAKFFICDKCMYNHKIKPFPYTGSGKDVTCDNCGHWHLCGHIYCEILPWDRIKPIGLSNESVEFYRDSGVPIHPVHELLDVVQTYSEFWKSFADNVRNNGYLICSAKQYYALLNARPKMISTKRGRRLEAENDWYLSDYEASRSGDYF